MLELVRRKCSRFTYLLTYLPTYLLTYLLHRAESFLVLQLVKKFPAFMEPKVHYHTHKWPPPVPILSPLHSVPTIPSHFLKIHLNIILPFTSGSPQWSRSLRLPHQQDYIHKVRATLQDNLHRES
jgi:hypothetical protein